MVRRYRDTPVDEHGVLVGVPVAAVLVLRNLARQIPKLEGRPEMAAQLGVSHPGPESSVRDGTGMGEEEEGERGDNGDDGDDEVLLSESNPRPCWRMKSPLVARTFGMYRAQLYYAMAHNLTLRDHLGSLANLIADACGGVF